MATAALAFTQIANECEAEGLTPKNAERIGLEIAKTFQLQADEVGILRLEKQNLVFMYPVKLHNVGSIPLNTTGSVAARTATNKRGEVINNFAQTKHTSIFEAVELDNKPKPVVGEKHEHVPHQIQKLMSVPVVGPAGVLGVIQTSRKGTSAPTAGADFTPADLQKLTLISTALAKCFR
jgi:hypothetical protein